MSKEIDWAQIEADYRSSDTPVLQLAKKYGVSEGTIRVRVKKYGWVRTPLPLKRALVEQKLIGITNGNTNVVATRKAIEDSADAAAEDMTRGLEVARACVARLGEMVPLCDNPRDVKVVAEANKIAVETIRRIRGLDDVQSVSAEIVIDRSYGGGV